MATTQVTLIYPPNLIKEPVLFTMAKKFDIMPNIRRAKITETIGEMTLELTGSEENLKRGIAFLEKQGVKVELITGNIVE